MNHRFCVCVCVCLYIYGYIWILVDYYEKPYANKYGNLIEMGKFLERQKLPKLTEEVADNPNSSVSIKLNL